MQTLFAPIKPYATHTVDVDHQHQLYVEESGNPHGIPALFVHGGPGGGSKPDHRRFFDPNLYRIVLFDQRGCGHSTPNASLRANTTPDLIRDIETIRQYLNIPKWVMLGSSWGGTLALLYAEAHPECVRALLLCGVVLCRDEDMDWLYRAGGASRIFPDAWEEFIGHIPPEEQDDLLQAYHRRLHGDDDLARMAAAKIWAQWHCTCSTLQPNPTMVSELTHPHIATSLARTQTHFFVNHAFLKPNQILNDIDKLTNIPGTLIHGRYDMLCPVDNAYLLHRAWLGSELQIVRDAGHTSSEPANINALVLATNQTAQHLNR